MAAKRQRISWIALLSGWLALATTALPSNARADSSLSLGATMTDLQRLAPDAPTAQSTFPVSDASAVLFDVLTTAAGVGVTLRLPNSTTVDETTIATIGGTAQRFDTTAAGAGPLIFPSGQPGHHIMFGIPNPLAGTWTLEFSEPAGSSDEIAVITQMFLDSPTGAGMTALPSEIVLGQAVTLTLAAYSGAAPITGATVNAQVITPSGVVQPLALLDDGLNADATTGDGLYSAALIPNETGEFTVLATLTGTTPAMTPITRQAAVCFTVVPPSAALLNNVTLVTVDSNGNGLIDQLDLQVGVNVFIAGDFLVTATLQASNGKSIRASIRMTESVASTVVTVSFTAEQVVDGLGVDGPYEVGPVEVTFLPNTGAVPADRIESFGQTPALLLSQFETPAIQFTSNSSFTGIDIDGNGLFDTLKVLLEVNIRDAGFYQWSGSLADPQGLDLGFATGSASLPAGTSQIELDIGGCQIGKSGVDGPYALRGVLMFGASHSLVVPGAVASSGFLAIQFECSCRLDMDASGPPSNAATDVVYLARTLLGLPAVPPSFRAMNGNLPADAAIAARVQVVGSAFDVDKNGVVDVATDAVYIMRHLLGLTPVPSSFRAIDPTIPPDSTIIANIDGLCP